LVIGGHMKYGKLVGEGNTAMVYEWEKGKVLKLFNSGYPFESIEKEFNNAKLIENMNFGKAKAESIVSCDNQVGIIYNKVKGESLLDWLVKTQNVEACASYMAELHQSILCNNVDDAPSYKDFLKSNIETIPLDDSKKRTEILALLDKLPDDDTLCHGDFHPGNILISQGQLAIIDFMNVCRGSYLYDVARTVFLVEYTPVPMEADNRDSILYLKRTLSELYLEEMNVTKEMIRDYLDVIIEARLGECPDEGAY